MKKQSVEDLERYTIEIWKERERKIIDIAISATVDAFKTSMMKRRISEKRAMEIIEDVLIGNKEGVN